jgi:hypothetical protein
MWVLISCISARYRSVEAEAQALLDRLDPAQIAVLEEKTKKLQAVLDEKKKELRVLQAGELPLYYNTGTSADEQSCRKRVHFQRRRTWERRLSRLERRSVSCG